MLLYKLYIWAGTLAHFVMPTFLIVAKSLVETQANTQVDRTGNDVDFPVRPVTCQYWGSRKVAYKLNRKSKQRLAQGKQNLRVACLKGS